VEGRSLSSRRTQQVVRNPEIGQPINSPSVRKLQMALHAKVKAEVGFLFCALCDESTVRTSCPRHGPSAAQTRGASGLAGQAFANVEPYGAQQRSDELAYQPTETVERLSLALRNWTSYVNVRSDSLASRRLGHDAAPRVRWWLRARYQVRRRKGGIYPLSHLYRHLQPVRLTGFGSSPPWAKA